MLRSTIALALLLSTLAPARPPSTDGISDGATHARATTAATHSQAAVVVPAPKDVLGFEPGEDRKLASWSSIVEYFRRLDASSERVRVEELGRTTMRAPFIMATISAPENLARLDEYREIQRRLADPRTLGRDADAKAADLIRRGKTIVLITCGIHSTEVGSTLSSTLIAHRLASSNDPKIQKILRETIVILVPSLNPDGVDIVKRWYDRTLGTPYEGTTPPELYHKYIGHDNNRDWYAFTQVETQLTVDKIHNVWRPQIVHDIHQQGAYGSRLFLPPYMQPVEPNVPKQLIEGYTELGLSTAKAMLAEGYKGITWNSSYDAWTPARAYSHYHGGVRILSETASARIASPITVGFEQLRAGDRGYDPRKASENYPVVWQGGQWRLSNIVDYMTTAAFHLLTHAADNRERWLKRFYEIGREAVRPREKGELQGFKIQLNERTTEFQRILERADVEVYRLENNAQRRRAPRAARIDASSLYVPLAQPYGAFAKALLEEQRYPDLRDGDGRPLPPYDVTAHTLPLLMGVKAEPVYQPVSGRLRPARAQTAALSSNRSANTQAGRAARTATRLALYKSHVPSMDEGWTRWILEQHGIVSAPLHDAEIRAGNLRARFDAILIPDQSPRALLEGHRKGTMPEELTGGIGQEGVKALREFIEAGGTLITLNEASDFAIEQFALPVRDVTAGLKQTEFYAPGSILRILLDTSHPIAAGMTRESVAWFEDSPAFEVVGDVEARSRVRIIARYPESGDPLLSGWLLGGERLRGRAALVEVKMGRGRVVLFGFRPQYRAQSLATYPLLFNALGANERTATNR